MIAFRPDHKEVRDARHVWPAKLSVNLIQQHRFASVCVLCELSLLRLLSTVLVHITQPRFQVDLQQWSTTSSFSGDFSFDKHFTKWAIFSRGKNWFQVRRCERKRGLNVTQTCGVCPTNQHTPNRLGLIMFAIFQNKTFLSLSQATGFVHSDYIFTSLYHIYTVLHTWKRHNRMS